MPVAPPSERRMLPDRVRTRLDHAAAGLLLLLAAPVLADQTVQVGPGLAFNPSNVTISPGEQITWVWNESMHSTTSNATSGPETWDSGILTSGAMFSRVFNTPGSHPYYCAVHSFPGGTAMNGVINVAGGATPTTTATATPTATLPIPTSTPTQTPIAPTLTPTLPGPTLTPTTPPTPGGVANVPALGFTGRLLLTLALSAAGVLLLQVSRRS